MKKVLLIAIGLVLIVALNAQDRTQSVSRVGSNVTFVGSASDTITDTDSWDYQWNLASKNSLQGYNLHVKLDSVSGTPADACVLAGSQDGTVWTTISTVTWTGTTADTTFIYNDVSTGILYRHLRLRITGTGTQKAKVNQIYGKIGDL